MLLDNEAVLTQAMHHPCVMVQEAPTGGAPVRSDSIRVEGPWRRRFGVGPHPVSDGEPGRVGVARGIDGRGVTARFLNRSLHQES